MAEGSEGYVPYRSVVAFVNYKGCVGVHRPETGGFVLGGGEEVFAVGGEGDSVNGARVAD